jgi:phage baseplate assembly protein W
MANGTTYGIVFPLRDSAKGNYFSLTELSSEEIRSNLLHLILTRRGSRYYLPDFGTRIYEFIFDPLDGQTFESLKAEIEQQVATYIPNLTLTNITIQPYLETEDAPGELNTDLLGTSDIYKIPGLATQEYTAKLRIDYVDKTTPFSSNQFIIVNI